jgi:hypothetical protein
MSSLQHRNCIVCNKERHKDDLIRKTRTFTQKNFSSSGCTISAIYFCKECLPESDEDYPSHTPTSTFVVGQVVSAPSIKNEMPSSEKNQMSIDTDDIPQSDFREQMISRFNTVSNTVSPYLNTAYTQVTAYFKAVPESRQMAYTEHFKAMFILFCFSFALTLCVLVNSVFPFILPDTIPRMVDRIYTETRCIYTTQLGTPTSSTESSDEEHEKNE